MPCHDQTEIVETKFHTTMPYMIHEKSCKTFGINVALSMFIIASLYVMNTQYHFESGQM